MKPGPLAGSTPGPGLITMVVHGGYEVVMAEGAVEWDKEKIIEKKKGGRMIFLSTLHIIFLVLRSWNPPLFIGGGRWTFCHCAKSWPLIQPLRIPNRWLKVAIMNCQICLLKATWVGLFGLAQLPLWCQLARKGHIRVSSADNHTLDTSLILN